MKRAIIITVCVAGFLFFTTMIAARDGSSAKPLSGLRPEGTLTAASATDTCDAVSSMRELIDVHERMFQAEGVVGTIVNMQARAVATLTAGLSSMATNVAFN